MYRQKLYLLFVLAVSLVFGQTERGTITGVVADPSGAAVAGARVALVHVATNTTLTVTTTAEGEYSAPNLSPGTYRLEISTTGFKRSVQNNVVLTAAGTVRVDVQLELGQVSEAVEVTAQVAQIQTENAKISTSVQNKMVDELPLVVGGAMRSPYNLVAVVPEARGDGTRMSLGGGQAASWNATLDGLAATTNRSADAAEAALLAPSIEALTEFTVDTNGFKAEYGQAGGGVMTFVSKSGTNQFHGNVYNFFRNDALDARGFFSLRRGVYKQNDFGVTMGGPVYVPKLYDGRNKTFFFFSYEGFRNRVGANDTIRTVPTPEMYSGDFRNWVDQSNRLLTIYDPATTRPNPSGSGMIRDPFPNNMIPQNRFSAFSRLVMPYGQAVTPNMPGIVPGTTAYVRNNFITTEGTLLEPTDKLSVKVDQNIGARQRLGFLFSRTNYSRMPGAGGPPGLPVPLWDGQEQAFDTNMFRMSHDYTFSANILNHFSIGGNTFNKNSFSPNVRQSWKDKLCFKNVVDCDVNFPGVTFTEFSTWGGVSYNGTEQPMWALKDDLSYIKGKHTLKMGYAFQSQRANGFGQQDISGRAGFSFLNTAVPGQTNFTSGSSFASFLLGEAFTGRTETDRNIEQQYRYHGWYIQDDWRITRKLMLNIGLRYEFTTPPVEANNQYSDFTPDRPNPAVNNFPGALRFAGFGPGTENVRTLVPGWYGGWGPRIGLAYSPDNKTTFRAAFGRSFARVTVVAGSGHFAGYIGQYVFQNTNQGLTATYNWDNGLPPYPLPPQLNPSFSNNNNVDHWQLSDATRAPESLYWTFSTQRQVTANTVLEIAYNATAGSRLQTGLVNLNQVPTAVWNDMVARFGPTDAQNLIRSQITSAQARAAGIPIPYPNFTDPTVQSQRSVAQALRPFPQFLNIVTGTQGGDKSGHSTYHAMVIKAERRYSSGLTFQWNYVLSKLLTDSDTFYANAGAAMDQYNRRLEKSIGREDQTHLLKFSTVYELPFGRDRKWLHSGIANHVLGGWRFSAIQVYASGFPLAISRNNPLQLFNGATRPVINGYENWRAPISGEKFDPRADVFYDRAAFPAQPGHLMGNTTRFNPKVRSFPMMNENISLAKSFPFGESRRADFRWEAFNLFNRTVFGNPTNNLNSNVFGVVNSQANDWRQMQLALKIYW
ncbi:MAG: TonB-dependent receptor domain-containing protein [Bryobacteraceae bacterium]